jgi:hypothetical protein
MSNVEDAETTRHEVTNCGHGVITANYGCHAVALLDVELVHHLPALYGANYPDCFISGAFWNSSVDLCAFAPSLIAR